MSGNEATRFCSYCKKHVHHLDALSADERLALLSSPAGSICSRYQLAIRRPAKGREAAYYWHLAKHGAGVAVVGSVMAVLWEMHGRADQERFYRVAGVPRSPTECPMPNHYYCEHHVTIVGAITTDMRAPQVTALAAIMPSATPLTQVDLKLDPLEIDKLIEKTKPTLADSGVREIIDLKIDPKILHQAAEVDPKMVRK